MCECCFESRANIRWVLSTSLVLIVHTSETNILHDILHPNRWPCSSSDCHQKNNAAVLGKNKQAGIEGAAYISNLVKVHLGGILNRIQLVPPCIPATWFPSSFLRLQQLRPTKASGFAATFSALRSSWVACNTAGRDLGRFALAGFPRKSWGRVGLYPKWWMFMGMTWKHAVNDR